MFKGSSFCQGAMDEVRMSLPTWMNSSNFLELESMKKPKGLPKYLVMSMLPREFTGVQLISNTVGMVDWWSEAMWTEKHLCGFTERPIRAAVSTRRLIESSKSCRVSSICPSTQPLGPAQISFSSTYYTIPTKSANPRSSAWNFSETDLN